MIELLIEARRAHGLTQAELGTRVGQRQSFISKVELGERRLDAAEFIELGRAIGADPYALMRQAEG
ncbi:helix-turn-helix domain-containing protein [Hansschlegelia sp.]|uniref:helix-turn-helix domain-containing protein n=1 Tax=Hansschlegelia sp. TaxID=2041892 RepID=UPI0039C8A1BB